MFKEPHGWLFVAGMFFFGAIIFFLSEHKESQVVASVVSAFDAGAVPKSIGAQIDGLIDGVTKCSQLNAQMYQNFVQCENQRSATSQCWNVAGFPTPPAGGRIEVITDQRPVFVHAGYCRAVDAGVVMCCKSESDGGCS